MKSREFFGGREITGLTALLAAVALAGCGGRNPNAISDCEPGYSGPTVVSAGSAVTAFSAEASKLQAMFDASFASVRQTRAFLSAYDQVYQWADWSDGTANTVDEAKEILCVEHDANGHQLVLNDHAEAIRGALKAAGIEFDLSGVIRDSQ